MKLNRDYFLPTGMSGPECHFVWNGREHRILLNQMQFPIVITRRGEIRPVKQRDHWRRVWLTLRGEWKRWYEIGDESPNKPGPLELTHALKNVAVEGLRATGIWNRGNKPYGEPSGYDWYELNKDNTK